MRLRVRVSGRVQGVWYRQSTADKANRLGVSGWIRNLPDGDVEAALEGERDTVSRMLDWMRQGPPGAIVTNLAAEEEDPQGETGFRVVRY